MLSILRPFAPLARPEFHGIDRIPDERPLLFVGNHTLYGILDVPFLYEHLYREKGIILRSLGDHLHFKVPGWRDLLTRFGVVEGTRENCAELMEAGACILVFPGGAREVSRLRSERHTLVWKERIGFAKMAIRHGCTIMPFSALGIDDAFEVLADADDFERSALGPWLERLGIRRDLLVPVPRSFHLEKLYFRIGDPIRTSHFEGHDDDEAAWEVRGRVARAIEDGIEQLKKRRATDPERLPGPIVRRKLQRTVTQVWTTLSELARQIR